jgi:hypothetical protein
MILCKKWNKPVSGNKLCTKNLSFEIPLVNIAFIASSCFEGVPGNIILLLLRSKSCVFPNPFDSIGAVSTSNILTDIPFSPLL